jgi:hypothetical protein
MMTERCWKLRTGRAIMMALPFLLIALAVTVLIAASGF